MAAQDPEKLESAAEEEISNRSKKTRHELHFLNVGCNTTGNN
jgi:hypothetical protein